MSKRIAVLFSFLLCGISLPASAQWPQQQNAIHVVGWGEIEAEPDTATFNFAIQGQSDSTENARARTDAISADLVRRLERLGVESKDIRSTPVTLNAFIDSQTRRELVSFNRMTTVTLRDLEQFDAVQNAAFEAGANSMGPVQFGLSNEDESATRARDLALMDARAQAEGIAKTMGIEVGRVLSVTVMRDRGMPAPMYRAEAFAADASPEHRAGTVEIVVSANVSFEIIEQPFIARP